MWTYNEIGVEVGVALPDRETLRAGSERWRAGRASRARPFPGLAPPADGGALTASEMGAALAGLPAARIGLVPAPRAADVLATIGWSMFEECYEPVPATDPAAGPRPRERAYLEVLVGLKVPSSWHQAPADLPAGLHVRCCDCEASYGGDGGAWLKTLPRTRPSTRR